MINYNWKAFNEHRRNQALEKSRVRPEPKNYRTVAEYEAAYATFYYYYRTAKDLAKHPNHPYR